MPNNRTEVAAQTTVQADPAQASPPLNLRARSAFGLHAGATLFMLGASGLYRPALAQDATLPAVVVHGQSLDGGSQQLNTEVSGGALGARKQLDTPFSTSVIKAEDLADRQVSKLGDVFALDASVSDNSAGYSSWATYVTVRGLPLDWQNAYRIDGKPFLGFTVTLPYEHFEQIELLKGASGFMHGFGSPGGVLNYVTKKPSDTPVRSIDLGYRSNSLWSQHVDLGGRLGSERRFGYRFNATHEEGDTFNDGSLRRNSVSLALDARLTRDLVWNFQGFYQDRKSAGQTPSINTHSYVGSILPRVPGNDDQTLLGPGQHLSNNLQFYSTGLQYRLSPQWNLSTHYSQSTTTRSRNEGILNILNASGDYDDFRSDSREGHRFDQWQALAQGALRTGAVEHQVVLGASWQKQLNDYSSNSFYGRIGSGNLFEQNTNSYLSSIALTTYRDSDITQRAIFASDTVKLSQRWSLLAGARRTDYEQNSYRFDGTPSQAPYEKSGVLTPTVALMFKPAPDTTLYASYVESLEQGARVPEGLGYVNQNTQLPPLDSKQYEVGLKTEHERWSATAALFRIERGAEYAKGNVFVQDGESIYQGLELGASTRLGSQWTVGGEVMVLDTSYERGSANQGKRVVGAPDYVVTARLAYAVAAVRGLRLTANAKYTGATMLTASNSLEVPGYTLVDAGASYIARLGGFDTTWRLAVNNLLGKRHWAYQYENYIKPADPRTLSLNARVDF